MHYFFGKGCSESLESMHYCIGILTCSYYVDFCIMAAVEAALVIMQCTAANLKGIAADDGRVGYAVKYVVITGVIRLIDSVSIIVDNG